MDERGALRDWWTAEDAARFEESAARLAVQFDAIEPYPGLHLNGRLTLGENIADLAGLLMSVDAYRTSLKGEAAPVIEGTTGEQRLFLGWAGFMRTKTREEVDRQSVAADVHPPPRYRLIGSTRNVDSWYEAFDVKPGTRYYLAPQERVRIW